MRSKWLPASLVVAVVCAVLAGAWFRRPTRLILTPERLRYPCLRIYDGINWEQINNETDLRSTPSNYYMNRKDDPLLIDSEFRVATMSKLKLQGSELGLLLTGPRPIQVDFELVLRSEISIAQARSLVDDLIHRIEPMPSHELSQANHSTASLAELIELLQRTRSR
jgi:hypothetical protein